MGILLSAVAWPGSVRAEPRAAGCLDVQQRGEEDARRISLHIANGCSRSVRCTVSWRVTCDPGESRDYQEATTVDAGGSTHFRPSAAICAEEAGYEIAAVKWACTQPPVTTSRPPRARGRR